MPYDTFTAFATTGEAPAGTRTQDGTTLTIHGQRFVDTVESSDPRVAGVNQLVLDLVVDTSQGTGTTRGSFVWTTARGVWRGELSGTLTGGLAHATGLARGEGAFTGAVLRAEWQQVAAHPGVAPVPQPLAFFTVVGAILS